MSSINLMPSMSMESYMDTQSPYVQPLSMDMLDGLSWPCQFMSPDLSPQYTASYPISPGSMDATGMPAPPQRQHQQQHHSSQRPPIQPLTPRTSASSDHSGCSSNGFGGASSSTNAGLSPTSPGQGFATVVGPAAPKQDRERRKAQNRASQRAYRERKEIQLRDLAASLKHTEAAMAQAKEESLALAARLEVMRKDLLVLRRENEMLRLREGGTSGSGSGSGLLQLQLQLQQEEEERRRRSKLQQQRRQEEELEESRAAQVQRQQQQQQPGGSPTTPTLTTPPPHTDEDYEGASRSNSASVIGTPKDEDFAMDGLDWDGLLLGSKGMPTVEPDLRDAEVFW